MYSTVLGVSKGLGRVWCVSVNLCAGVDKLSCFSLGSPVSSGPAPHGAVVLAPTKSDVLLSASLQCCNDDECASSEPMQNHMQEETHVQPQSSRLMAGQAAMFQAMQQLGAQLQQLQASSHQRSLHQDGCFASSSMRQVAATQQSELVRHTVQAALPAAGYQALLSQGAALPATEPAPARSKAGKRKRKAAAAAEQKTRKLQSAASRIAAAAVTGADPMLSPASKTLVAKQQQHDAALAAKLAPRPALGHDAPPPGTSAHPAADPHQLEPSASEAMPLPDEQVAVHRSPVTGCDQQSPTPPRPGAAAATPLPTTSAPLTAAASGAHEQPGATAALALPAAMLHMSRALHPAGQQAASVAATDGSLTSPGVQRPSLPAPILHQVLATSGTGGRGSIPT